MLNYALEVYKDHHTETIGNFNNIIYVQTCQTDNLPSLKLDKNNFSTIKVIPRDYWRVYTAHNFLSV